MPASGIHASGIGLCLALLGAAVPSAAHAAPPDLALVNRLSWGETAQDNSLDGQSLSAWEQQQLHPGDDGLPQQVQAQIAAMEISRKSLSQISDELRELRQAQQRAQGTTDADAARKAYQDKLNQLMREAQTRSLLRDLYSRNQLKEQLTWFWFNHFNVHAAKGEIRAFVGDYENTLRDRAFGKFGDLLAVTAIHPAMLLYLDNAQNAKGHINENYAREIMELHTLGVGSGYSQQDVQELARVLTGVGVDLSARPLGGWRNGDFRYDFPDTNRSHSLAVFNALRHDFGDKQFLGTTIKGSGINEVATALYILAVEPPTAHFVSRKLAQYFCCDAPSPQLVNAMAATWKRSNGEIAQVLETLFASPEFAASLGSKFKDPVHYAVSAVRATYGDQPISDAQPMLNWLNRMGEPLFGHETPDGYPLTAASWSGPGDMATRFEIARQIGGGARQLFKPQDGPVPAAPPPLLQQTAYYTALTPALSQATTSAIAQGASQTDRNMLFLSSPEFMRR
jgi:uncharacterized protein (DUF1800 family)